MDIDKKQLNTARNYAKALIQIAWTQSRADIVCSQLLSALEVLKTSSDLNSFLTNPLIPNGDKKEIIYKVFGKDFDLQIINLMNLLVDNNKFSLYETVCFCYEKLYEGYKGISKVEVISAIEPNEESRQRISEILNKKLNGSEIILNYTIKPEILGGLIIKIQDKVIDLSLASKLKDMEKQLI